jgi:hypothetical protein
MTAVQAHDPKHGAHKTQASRTGPSTTPPRHEYMNGVVRWTVRGGSGGVAVGQARWEEGKQGKQVSDIEDNCVYHQTTGTVE